MLTKCHKIIKMIKIDKGHLFNILDISTLITFLFTDYEGKSKGCLREFNFLINLSSPHKYAGYVLQG